MQSQAVTEKQESSYYKVITECDRSLLQSESGITKWDRSLLKSGSGIKKCDRLFLQSVSGITQFGRPLLQNVSGIRKYDSDKIGPALTLVRENCKSYMLKMLILVHLKNYDKVM